MSTFILIHGAWHGAWCWTRITPLLQAAGHSVIAPDLPGHGDNRAALTEVSLTDYVMAVTDILDQLEEKAIIVGHSMGGIIISAAAEKRPGMVQALVYLAAFLPRDGQSLAGMEQSNPRTAVPPHLVISDDGLTATVREDKITDLFYHDCDPEVIEFAKQRLCPQPLRLLNTPVVISPENYGRLPRHYILCTEDRALCHEFQDEMINAATGTVKHTLNSSHSPFFSSPNQLAELLCRIAG